MLRFLNGLLLGTYSSAGAAADPAAGAAHADPAAGGGGGSGAAPANDPAKGGGEAAKPWAFPTEKAFAEYLPDAYKTDANFRDIKDFDGLLKSFVGARKMVGLDKGKLVPIPANDDAKDWDAVYNQLGRPETADKYDIPKPGEGKEYSPADLATQKALLPILHAAGVTQRQLAAIVPKWNELQAAVAAGEAEKIKADIATADAALTKDWGAAKEKKLGLGKEALAFLDGELKLGGGLTGALDQVDVQGNRLGNHPALSRLFAYFGEQMEEDGLLGKGGPGGAEIKSPAEAQQEINALRGGSDPAFSKAWLDKGHAGHADAVARMQRLHEMAHPAEGGS